MGTDAELRNAGGAGIRGQGEMDVLSLRAVLQRGPRVQAGCTWAPGRAAGLGSSWASDLPDLKLKPKNLCPHPCGIN